MICLWIYIPWSVDLYRSVCHLVPAHIEISIIYFGHFHLFSFNIIHVSECNTNRLKFKRCFILKIYRSSIILQQSAGTTCAKYQPTFCPLYKKRLSVPKLSLSTVDQDFYNLPKI